MKDKSNYEFNSTMSTQFSLFEKNKLINTATTFYPVSKSNF